MKKVLFAGVALAALSSGISAQAADLPNRKKAPVMAAQTYAPAPAAFSWTGFYLGANAGLSTGTFTKNNASTFGTPKGGMLGLTAGYNYQINQFVAGLEADYDWAHVARNATFQTTPSAGKASLSSIGTIRGRLGFAADRALVYATGGYAFGSIKSKDYGLGLNQSVGHSGYALGAGIEYAFTNNISAKAEYLYTSLGKKTYFGGTADATQVGIKASTVKVGLNYHF